MQLLACVSEAAGLGQDGSQGYRCAETNDLLWAARNLTTQGPDPQPDGGETVTSTRCNFYTEQITQGGRKSSVRKNVIVPSAAARAK